MVPHHEMEKESKNDLFEILKKDHRLASKLIDELADTSDRKRVKRLVDEIYQELELHTAAEEETLYPRLKEKSDTKEFVAEAREEHAEIREWLNVVQSGDVDDDDWESGVEALLRSVKHHVTEEEQEIFPVMEKAFTASELEQIRNAFLKVKTQLKRDLEAA